MVLTSIKLLSFFINFSIFDNCESTGQLLGRELFCNKNCKLEPNWESSFQKPLFCAFWSKSFLFLLTTLFSHWNILQLKQLKFKKLICTLRWVFCQVTSSECFVNFNFLLYVPWKCEKKQIRNIKSKNQLF